MGEAKLLILGGSIASFPPLVNEKEPIVQSHWIPEHIRSDNGPEFTARVVQQWLGHIGMTTLNVEPGNPWGKGYNENFNGKLRDEVLNREVFLASRRPRL